MRKADVSATTLEDESAVWGAMPPTPQQPQSSALSDLGATLTTGDYDNDDALRQAMTGVNGAFPNLMPDFVDHTWELKAAKRIMAAAKDAGATHFIYSSSFSVQAPERLRHWDPESFNAVALLSKQSIEKEVRKAGFQSWTILHPGNFADNYLLPLAAVFPDLVNERRWVTAFKLETKLPTVDPNDIGKFALAAYRDPTRFNGQEIPISAELLTPDEIMAKLAKFTGKDFKAVYLSEEEVDAQKAGIPFLGGQLAARDMDQFADQENTESWGVPLGTFDEFPEREKARVKETYGQLA